MPQITVESRLSNYLKSRGPFGGNMSGLIVETGEFFTEANPAGVDAANIQGSVARHVHRRIMTAKRTISLAILITRAA